MGGHRTHLPHSTTQVALHQCTGSAQWHASVLGLRWVSSVRSSLIKDANGGDMVIIFYEAAITRVDRMHHGVPSGAIMVHALAPRCMHVLSSVDDPALLPCQRRLLSTFHTNEG